MQIPKNINLICILGPTASGKTAFAAQLAGVMDSEIISADSRQVYRGMDIGTGKDYNDYLIGDKTVPYHLIDIANAGDEYNVFQYQKDFYKVFIELQSRGIVPILCGGSGLYIESVLKSYNLTQVPLNPELRQEIEGLPVEMLTERLKSYRKLHNTTDLLIRKRLIRAIEIEEYLLKNTSPDIVLPEIFPIIFGLDIDRESRREKITKRLKIRLEEGMIEEVKNLIESGIPMKMLEFYGLEYKYICYFLSGKISYNEMFDSLNIAIHQFAKRQMTWFRKMEKQGIEIHWIDVHLPFKEKLSIVN